MADQMQSGFTAAPRPIRSCEAFERWLLLGALAVAVLLDLLVFNASSGAAAACGYSVFWLVYLAVFYACNWQRAKKRADAWFVGAFCALVCVWQLLFAQQELSILSRLLVPIALMLHAQLGVLSESTPFSLFANVFFGFFAQPFSAIGKTFSAFASVISAKNKRLSHAALGLLVALPVAGIVLALLFSADGAFSYYGSRLFADFNLGDVLLHFILIFVTLMLFYSFLWNLRYKPENYCAPIPAAPPKLEPAAVGVVLGILLVIYLLFSIVQAAFLFGGAALPSGITYSEYARTGFFQLIEASGINFVIFALALRFTKPSAAIRYLLLGLLAATGILLVSGVTRLSMYISEYGLTWLRVVSMWFMAFLAAAIVLGGVRLFKPRLQLLKTCAALLMVFSLALCFVNVDSIIVRYDIGIAENGVLDEDTLNYVYSLSNDCVDDLIAYVNSQNGAASVAARRLLERRNDLRARGAYTLSDINAWNKLETYFARE